MQTPCRRSGFVFEEKQLENSNGMTQYLLCHIKYQYFRSIFIFLDMIKIC